MKEGVEVDQTLAGAELRRIVNLADQASLIKYKKSCSPSKSNGVFLGQLSLRRYDS